MKTIKNSLLLVLLLIIAISCETEFAPVGSDIIGGDNFNFVNQNFPVTAYSKPVGPVQTNNIGNYLLGHYKDPVYGGSTASIVSQVSLSSASPTFGDSETLGSNDIVLDSVVLNLPYFSAVATTDTDGNSTYTLDSIYGNSSFNISVYYNNFFLRNFNPESETGENQRYFSNTSTGVSSPINQNELEHILLYTGAQDISTGIPQEYMPNYNEIRLLQEDQNGLDSITARLPPAIRLKLDNPNNFWQTFIFDKEDGLELENINNFYNHFRGLYIKTAANNEQDGTMSLIDWSDANVTLYYTPTEDEGATSLDQETVVLNFSGNTVNLLENNFTNALPVGNETDGDTQLFLKGGEGSMAVVNLFNGGDDGESEDFTEFKNLFVDEDGNPIRLINEAYLEVFVDQTIVNGEEPNRLYLYDLKNNRSLVDLASDATVNSSGEQFVTHLEPLTRVNDDATSDGVSYKFRITDHINNLILNDSTNVKLGLVVSSGINQATIVNRFLQTEDDVAETLPIGSILSPRGTVLYGSNASVNPDNQIKLKIFYSETNN